MNLTRRSLLTGVSSFALMGFLGGHYQTGGVALTPATHPATGPVEYVDAVMMHSGATGPNEFTTWSAAKAYLNTHPDIVAGTHRGRVTYKYSTTPYGDTQVPEISYEGGDRMYWSLQCIGELGGPATRVDETYVGDDVTSQFDWDLPGGVTAPIGPGDLIVEINGVRQRVGRDYQFLYDAYDQSTVGYPSLGGSIKLIQWSGDPASANTKVLATGETLTISSVEARPILDTTAAKRPVRLTGQIPNPERYPVTDAMVFFYGMENFVCTTSDIHNQSIYLRCIDWRIKGCFLFKLGQNGITDTAPQSGPQVRGQGEIINSSLFDCGIGGARYHNAYIGRWANIILDNVFSSDTALNYGDAAHAMKVKPTDKLFVRGCFFGERSVSDWMGKTGIADTGAPFSTYTECTTMVFEDNIFHRRDQSRCITINNRASPFNMSVGSHGPGVENGKHPMATWKGWAPDSFSKTEMNNVEWTEGATAGQTVFPWSHPTDWDMWDPATKDDFVVGVWNGTFGVDMQLIDSDGFSATGLGTTSGTIDLSGGASPSFPGGVAAGAWVFVSPHFKKDRSDYWTPGWWDANIKICGVFAVGFASGATSSVPWSQAAPVQGTVDNPADADFHVSVNGVTLTLGSGYTVTGGGTTSGTIEFSPSLSDGDFYMITTDGHKTQGVTPVFLEDVHTWYYNNVYSPGDPTGTWTPGEGYRWPTVKRAFFFDNEFQMDVQGITKHAIVTSFTRPVRDDASRTSLPILPSWRERFATYAANNKIWNYDRFDDDIDGDRWGMNVVSPQYNDPIFDTWQGVAPSNPVTKNLLPDWWETIENEPTRLVV